MTEEDKRSSEQIHKPSKLNLFVDVYSGMNQKDIAKKYKRSKSTVSDWFKKIGEKFIKKAGYGTWELTELAIELIKGRDLIPTKEGEYFIDDIQVTFDVRLKEALPFRDGQWNLSKFATFSETKFGEFTIRNNNNKSITIIFPKLFGKDELEPVTKALLFGNNVMRDVVARWPQIEIINPIPRVKSGSLGSTTLNKYLAPITRNITVRTPELSIDNTPRPGSLEIKMDMMHPYTAGAKLKDVIEFITSGSYKTEIEGLRESNKIVIIELQGLAQIIASFSKTLGEFIEMERRRMEK